MISFAVVMLVLAVIPGPSIEDAGAISLCRGPVACETVLRKGLRTWRGTGHVYLLSLSTSEGNLLMCGGVVELEGRRGSGAPLVWFTCA